MNTHQPGVALSLNFVKISLVYFVIGSVWMGFSSFLESFVPKQDPASMIYDAAETHVMLLGWASFAIIGMIYYLVPKALEKELYSERLGRIHFWITNAVVPIGILIMLYGSFVMESLLESGVSDAQLFVNPSIVPLLVAFLLLVIIGLAAQIVFVYNIYRTTRANAPQMPAKTPR